MRILVLEDNARLVELIGEGLVGAGYVVDCALSLEEAEGFLESVDYDLVVLDLSLPDGSGRDLLKTLRRRGRATPVLVVTARIDTQSRIGTLDDGADDYLQKPFDMDELIARVRAILRRPRQLAQTVLEAGNLVLDCGRFSAQVGGRTVGLQRRELNALEVLLRNSGSLVSRRKLEDALYAADEAVTPNALEAVVSRLRKKLDLAGATVSITAMRGIGYILTDRP